MGKKYWSDGHKVRTLGPHTGHVVQDIAFCVDAETATRLADAFDLLEAAKPFLDVLEKDIGESETDEDLFAVMMQHNRAKKLTVGDFRRLAKAAARAEGKE